jgi:hypothetical protein
MVKCNGLIRGKPFVLLEIIEVAIKKHLADNTTYPPIKLRLTALRQVIKAHPVYQMTERLRNTVNKCWGLLSAFKSTIGFNATSTGLPFHLSLALQNKLTAFGREFYVALMDHAGRQFEEIYGSDYAAYKKDYYTF